MKDEALKLALKALEEWYFGCGAGSESHDDAVEAIKQALAAPVREHLTGLDIYLDPNDGLKPKRYPAAQPAPVQEPVAWWNGEYGSPVFGFKRDTPGIGLGNPDATPLYTTPPAAQQSDVDAMVALARADEREACAKVCDAFQARDVGMQPAECAGAIRARGNT
jgi:hypothetical protein